MSNGGVAAEGFIGALPNLEVGCIDRQPGRWRCSCSDCHGHHRSPGRPDEDRGPAPAVPGVNRFERTAYVVNPRRNTVQGAKARPNLGSLRDVPDHDYVVTGPEG